MNNRERAEALARHAWKAEYASDAFEAIEAALDEATDRGDSAGYAIGCRDGAARFNAILDIVVEMDRCYCDCHLPAGEELAVLTERAAILEDAASAICGVTRIAKEIADDLIELEGEVCERGCGEPKHLHRTKERLLAPTSASEGASP